jgi:murein DD-endopeptidase MepM/ murein hydrolase activator NlpD
MMKGQKMRAGMSQRLLAFIMFLAAGQVLPGQAPSSLAISTRARALQQGEVVILEVSCACSGPTGPATAKAFGRTVALAASPDGSRWSGLIGVDVETRPGDYPISVTVEKPTAPPLTGRYLLSVKAKQFPTRRLTVAPSFVDPPADALERITKEAERLEALFRGSTPREAVGPFQMPIATTPGNTFGARSVFNGQARNPHGGLDFGSPTGTPIGAPAGGAVALAEDLYFTGNTVVLDHGRGLYSVLAHLSKINVSTGDQVRAGQIVGNVGATGRVTGPHLHWGVRLNMARVDPRALVEILAP